MVVDSGKLALRLEAIRWVCEVPADGIISSTPTTSRPAFLTINVARQAMPSKREILFGLCDRPSRTMHVTSHLHSPNPMGARLPSHSDSLTQLNSINNAVKDISMRAATSLKDIIKSRSIESRFIFI